MRVLSLCLTAFVIGVFSLYRWRSGRSGRSRPRQEHLFGCDLLTLTVVERLPLRDRGLPILAFIVWVAVSGSVGIFLPANVKSDCFSDDSTVFSALIYTLIVPALLAAYVALLVAAQRFLDPEKSRDLGIVRSPHVHSRLWSSGYQLTLIVATLIIQYLAIGSVEAFSVANNPWVEKGSSGPGVLNWAGMIYYSLRGLDAYFGLGLLGSITSLWWVLTQRVKCERPEECFDRSFSLRGEVRGVGTALAFFTILAPLATMAQGIVLKLEIYDAAPARRPQTYMESTWLFWALSTLVATILAVACIHWLHKLRIQGLQRIETKEIESIERVLRVENQESKFWDARSKLREALDRADTSPWPRGAYVTALLGAVVQLLTLAATFVKVIPPR